MSSKRKTDRYMFAVISVGVISLVSAAWRLPLQVLDVYALLLLGITVGLGSRVSIKIPRFKSHIAVSDTFIFLSLLMYGGEFAIILSALEALFSSWRFCNRKLTVFFNAATMAVSTSAVVLVINLAGMLPSDQTHPFPKNLRDFVILLSAIALVQFGVNTLLATIYDALKNELPLFETWKTKYIWAFFSYFIGAASAGLIIQMVDTVGLGIIFATFPVMFFLYFSYRMYMKNVEISIQQAEQAEQYAMVMESQSEALRESEERFRSAFNYAPIGIALVSSTGHWLKVNRALCDILGYSEDEFLKVDFQSMIFPEDLGETLVKLHLLFSGKIPSCQMEHRYVHKSGRTVWASWSVSAANDAETENLRLIFQIQDITDKKVVEEKLQHEATHDALTGLPNRSMFMARLSTALERVRESRDFKVSILFIDLDRFKYVNDSLGHIAGDMLLKEISVRLRDCLRPTDLVARLGGDEFTILVEGFHDDAEVTNIADRIQSKFNIPFELNGSEVYSSASIGILHASENHLSSEDMMRDADTAMYQAKKAGKARHEVFDENMFRSARETLRLETDLRRAIQRNELFVQYQPIYSLETNQVEGIEALARWRHGELGEIPPSKFIPIAEEIGVIDRLFEFILRTACRDIGELHHSFSNGSRPALSVNLSCRQFARKTLVREIETILADQRFSPSLLKFEITESVFVEHQGNALETLQQMRDLGIDINIDDFGTGYSNLSNLTNLPISTLKIDRSFVGMIDENGSNSEIVKAIVTLARNLKLRVVAEGIETAAQLECLKNLGCDAGQGYYFAPPIAFSDLVVAFEGDQTPNLPPHALGNIPEVSALQ